MTSNDENIPVFTYEETFDLTLKNGEKIVVYEGYCPIDHMHSRDFTGERFYVNGVVRTVRMAKTYATMRGPSQGTTIGLVFYE